MELRGAEILFFLIFSFIDTTLVFGQCERNFNEEECIYNVNCLNFVDETYDTYNTQNMYRSQHCDNIVYFNGQNFYGISLVYKDHSNDGNNIPKKRNTYGQSFFPIVKHLDVSGNQYNTIPNFVSMENLVSLNLSHNLLRNAKLSNNFKLLHLSDIDLSYNTINTLQVNSFEYIYTNIKKINISNNYIVDLPDAIFDSFTQLQTLDLSHNFIDSLSISSFEGIKKLITLMFSHNRISEINNAFFRFSELQVLDLSFNRIEKIKFSDFEKLTKLIDLNLRSNIIHTIDKSVFSTIECLQTLNLRDNKLDYIDKNIFANTTNLNSVDISGNNFRTLPRGLFKDKNITHFSFEDNQLEGPLLRGSFEGLKLIKNIDLSYQQLTAIEDYAFLGLDEMTQLLLNNNHIQSLSKNSFKTLQNLSILDLSNNNITIISFDPEDLINLQSISFKNNFLTQIKYEQFQGMQMLIFLDLSNNNISNIEPDSFKSLHDLVNLEISSNPLGVELDENTFNGLYSLPSLVISFTQLTSLKNGSFLGMNQLKELNASHSKISDVQYNSFIGTGSLQSIDLSHNQLRIFDINTTELINLGVLYLNNNLLKNLLGTMFLGISHLETINLCHNHINNVDKSVFIKQKDLRQLDLSYNLDIHFDVEFISKNTKLYKLFLSGVNNVNFSPMGENTITFLEISYAGITNITEIGLWHLFNLENLILSNNNILRIEIGAFSNMTNLRQLDLSCNNISFIQPGVFKDNTRLHSLNISHNALTAISYGIFRGLIYLSTLDMSYNNVNSLETERFYEVRSLSVLIADHNKINNINVEEFSGTSLTKLSIGENPLPCEILVNFKRKEVPFTLTAIKIDESTDENVDGVTCNMNGLTYSTKSNGAIVTDSDKILIDIRNVLFNIANKNSTYEKVTRNNNNFNSNITNKIEIVASELNKTLLQSLNGSLIIAQESSKTNMLLEKVLALLNHTIRTTPVPITIVNDNNKTHDFINYINEMKQVMQDDMAVQKNIIMDEVKKMIGYTTFPMLSKETTTPNPKHEKLSASDLKKDSNTSSVFTETGVALILFILVCLVLYKFYKSRMFVRTRRSYSTRELPGSMESPSL